MNTRSTALVLAFSAALSACGQGGDKVERGKYLVTVISCGDCHTPGALVGKPNMASYLGGGDIGFFSPEGGYFYGPNLTFPLPVVVLSSTKPRAPVKNGLSWRR